MIDFSFKHTDLSYEEWYALVIQLMPQMMIDEREGEMVISTGLDSISLYDNAIQDLERE